MDPNLNWKINWGQGDTDINKGRNLQHRQVTSVSLESGTFPRFTLSLDEFIIYLAILDLAMLDPSLEYFAISLFIYFL